MNRKGARGQYRGKNEINLYDACAWPKVWEKQTCLVDFKWKCACYQSNNRSSRLKDWRKALGVEPLHPKRLEALGINEKVNKFNLVCCGPARFPYLYKKNAPSTSMSD